MSLYLVAELLKTSREIEAINAAQESARSYVLRNCASMRCANTWRHFLWEFDVALGIELKRPC